MESNNSYVVCHHFDEPAHTSVMLVCDNCAAVSEKHAHGVEKIIAGLADQAGFTLRHSVIEAHGLCENCAEVAACTQPGSCQHDHEVESKKKVRKGNWHVRVPADRNDQRVGASSLKRETYQR